MYVQQMLTLVVNFGGFKLPIAEMSWGNDPYFNYVVLTILICIWNQRTTV